MSSILEVYEFAQELVKHKEELMKDPDAFRWILEDLRKAAEKSSKHSMSQWQPRTDYSDKEKAAVEDFKNQGYSHREAERMAGAHKTDFYGNMKSGVAPSVMSEKMMGDLKPLAKLWLEEASKREKANADPESNTVKRQSGKLSEAYERHTAPFSRAYNDFLKSDELKDLKGRDRHKAVQAWKSQWKDRNPQHDEALSDISDVQQKFAYSQPKAKQVTQEKHEHIASGGQSTPTEMSSQEAMQHLGGDSTEEGHQGTIIKDPSASFAERNPHIISALKPEQHERLKAIDSAAKAQGKVRIRRKEST